MTGNDPGPAWHPVKIENNAVSARILAAMETPANPGDKVAPFIGLLSSLNQ